MCLGRAHRHAIPYRGKLPLAEPLHLTPQISGHFHRLCRATPHTLLVCVHVSVEELGSFGIGRARGVGVCQQRLNGCQDGVDREDGGPPVLDDVQAQGAVTVDYGRPNDQSMYTTTKSRAQKRKRTQCQQVRMLQCRERQAKELELVVTRTTAQGQHRTNASERDPQSSTALHQHRAQTQQRTTHHWGGTSGM